ncbi:MAG: AAA family ATPase [Pseudoflavonifractor sp.]|nr:AAA family ATPase [Alloprevotella sp.]MCM1116508.1 AAA family ATPase [Pseudoflavonifractor sp.]
MDTTELAERIFLNLPYSPTDQQVEVLAALARFCSDDQPSDSAFLLAGYAGTGKTSLMGALVKTLKELGRQTVLMAPTGRAAKVFGNYAGTFASTIHRRIYRAPAPGESIGFVSVADNPLRDAVFIIDEASMIADNTTEGRTSLLDDLVYYVYSGEGCRMILLGDTAQLPPVGSIESPAMNVARLKGLGLRVWHATMTQTVRQASDSGILYNATWLRRALRHIKIDKDKGMEENVFEPILHVSSFPDVSAINGEEIEDAISSSYRRVGIDNTIVVTRSNRRAVAYNSSIRSRILDREEELCRGERLMVAKNNYMWSAKVKGLDFIANGDIASVGRIIATEEKYGLRFADVELSFPDRDISLQAKIMLSTLMSETPSLEPARLNALASDILADPDIFTPSTPMRARMKLLRSDPYFNALQVKYAYAVTCHKSQGGQWADVYVDMGFIPPEMLGVDYYRWLYTATTRATQRLYYVAPEGVTIR